MNPSRPGPMSAPEGQPSDSRIRQDPAIHPQDSGNQLVATGLDARERALVLLKNLLHHQAGLRRTQALAWERAAFSEVFDHSEPGIRIRQFLDKG
jgi:hypothetical protein